MHPNGFSDFTSPGWNSWHVPGSGGHDSPGPSGSTCNDKGNHPEYCYASSCGGSCSDDGCGWTHCYDDVSFVEDVISDVKSLLCVDDTRMYATGCSNGGMMSFHVAESMSETFAAAAPVCGSYPKGYLNHTEGGLGVPIMTITGRKDETVPGNATRWNKGDEDKVHPLSSDGYYYTSVGDITERWSSKNGCVTDQIGMYHVGEDVEGEANGLSCITHGRECRGGDVISCSWDGGHDYYGGSGGGVNAPLVWGFLKRWRRNRDGEVEEIKDDIN